MLSKLKTLITKKFDALTEAEINAKVNAILADREAKNIEYITEQTKEKYKIIPAFVLDGVQYFQFEDPFNIALGRGMGASEFYNEFSMRCSREYLQAYCTAVNNAINNPKTIELTKVAKLTTQLQERLDLIFDEELLYKLASVVYFDEKESPYEYDFKYNLEKITNWKKKKLAPFFLQQPLKDIIPLTNLSEQDLQDYITIGRKVNKTHLMDISTMLSEKDKKKDFYKTITSQLNTDTDTQT